MAPSSTHGRLPGEELITKGMSDLAQGIESQESLLVSIGAPRLRQLGLTIPEPFDAPEHRLYELLRRHTETEHIRVQRTHPQARQLRAGGRNPTYALRKTSAHLTPGLAGLAARLGRNTPPTSKDRKTRVESRHGGSRLARIRRGRNWRHFFVLFTGGSTVRMGRGKQGGAKVKLTCDQAGRCGAAASPSEATELHCCPRLSEAGRPPPPARTVSTRRNLVAGRLLRLPPATTCTGASL